MVTAWGKYLRAYPVSEWELLETKLLTEGKEQPGMASFVRLIVSAVTECSLDKQGRILLPPSLRNETNLTKEVVLNGMLGWVEIWDKDAWEAEHQTTKDNFGTFEQNLSKLGIF
jgi:MraZ protein